MKNLVTVFALLFTLTNLTAQSKLHFFIGPGLGQVQGDLTETGIPHYKSLKLNGKLGVGYDFNDKWGLRLHASGGRFHGSDFYTLDQGKHGRGGTFNSLIIDGGLTLKYQNIIKSTKYINYAFAGVDYMFMNPTVTYAGNLELPAERAFSNHQVNIPVGIGLGYWITNNIGILYEGSVHFTFTDYVDGVSLAGNPRRKDNFIDSHIMLLFRFGGKKGGKAGRFKRPSGNLGALDCPKF